MLMRRMLPVTVRVSLGQTMVYWYVPRWMVAEINSGVRKRCMYAGVRSNAIAAFLLAA